MVHLYYLEKKNTTETKWGRVALTYIYVFLMFSHYFQMRLSSAGRLARVEQPFSD